jgi:hypothetical protein
MKLCGFEVGLDRPLFLIAGVRPDSAAQRAGAGRAHSVPPMRLERVAAGPRCGATALRRFLRNRRPDSAAQRAGAGRAHTGPRGERPA